MHPAPAEGFPLVIRDAHNGGEERENAESAIEGVKASRYVYEFHNDPKVGIQRDTRPGLRDARHRQVPPFVPPHRSNIRLGIVQVFA